MECKYHFGFSIKTLEKYLKGNGRPGSPDNPSPMNKKRLYFDIIIPTDTMSSTRERGSLLEMKAKVVSCCVYELTKQ